MTVWEALILGIVQGLCEFLPVSSSGHLLLLSKLFGISESAGGAFFSVMLHVATLIAVVIVYRRRILELIRHPLQKLVLYLIVATLPTVLVALAMKAGPLENFYNAAENGAYLGVSFLATSVILILCDEISKRTAARRSLKKMGLRDALVIGGMQCVGVLPGVSRSGSTIAGATFSGLDKRAAADFSFLMSIPAILGGMVLEVKDAIEAGGIGVDIAPLLIGMAAAGITGYFAVRLMLTLITKKKLVGFAVYTALLGVVTIILQLTGVV